MAFGGFEPEARSQRTPPLAEINMTPMIDVMLVLLVIFIISAPLFSRSIGLRLPKETVPASAAASGPRVAVALDKSGQLFWEGAKITDAELDTRFAQAAARQPQPDIAFSADEQIPYARIAHVMAAAQRAGVRRFGFVVGH